MEDCVGFAYRGLGKASGCGCVIAYLSTHKPASENNISRVTVGMESIEIMEGHTGTSDLTRQHAVKSPSGAMVN